jgi:hypothetical protein
MMPRMKAAPILLSILMLAASPMTIGGATPPVPTISAVVSGPGMMYPDPAVSVVPTAPRVEDFPYVTEEFFVSGTAANAPYQTRIVVRRPRDPGTFSGTVVAEAQHAGGRSLIFEWSRVSVLTRRHLFVEIVHAAANVNTLKTFNAERYGALSIANGQANEIIAQVGRLVKAKAGPFAAYDVKRITLMGTSASSNTVRTYLAAHADQRMPDGKPIYDGFLLTSTLGNTPLPTVDVPMIQMPTQTEVVTYATQGNKYRRPDSDEQGNRFRLYEVAGMPHNNARDRPEFQTDPCTLPVTDFNAGAFTALGLQHLIAWIADGKAPPHAAPIEVDGSTDGDNSPLTLDAYGNARGGVRNVWVDVPVATYGVMGKGKAQAQDRLCQLAGTEVPLPDATLRKLYRNKGDYESQVAQRLNELVRDGWFLQEYVDATKADARATAIP